MKFSTDEHFGTFFINASNLILDEYADIYVKIREFFYENNIATPYIGASFSRFDIAVEFSMKQVKLISYFIRTLQQRLNKEFGEKSSESGSLIISTRIIPSGVTEQQVEKPDDPKEPIRFYTFLRMNTNDWTTIEQGIQQLIARTEEIGLRTSIYWNPSSYPFLLVYEGRSFEQMFKFLINMRIKGPLCELLNKTSTFVCLDQSENVIDETPTEKSIVATCYCMMNPYYCWIDTDEECGEKKQEELRLPENLEYIQFGGFDQSTETEKFRNPIDRMGGFDKTVVAMGNNLGEVLKALNEIRKSNKGRITNTATVLGYPWEKWDYGVKDR